MDAIMENQPISIKPVTRSCRDILSISTIIESARKREDYNNTYLRHLEKSLYEEIRHIDKYSNL